LYEKRGVPVCVSANIDLFKELMGDFKQYEKLNKVKSYLLRCQISNCNICNRSYVHLTLLNYYAYLPFLTCRENKTRNSIAHFSNFLRVTETKRLQLIFLSIFSWLSGCTPACKSIYIKVIFMISALVIDGIHSQWLIAQTLKSQLFISCLSQFIW